MRERILFAALTFASVLASDVAHAAPTTPANKRLLDAMEAELARSLRSQKSAGPAPLYFIAYRVYDTEDASVSATYGALDSEHESPLHRTMDVEVRVGSPALDNTHRLRAQSGRGDLAYRAIRAYPVPIEDDEAPIRAAFWAATDAEIKRAQKRLTEVKANKSVLADEEDASADFSVEKPQVYIGPKLPFSIDKAAWQREARAVSSVFREEPSIESGSVSLAATRTRRTYANSEGTRIQDEIVRFRVMLYAHARADDGMVLRLYDSIEAPAVSAIPPQAELETRARNLALALRSMRTAPPADPFAGPAILGARASAVFFHEVFGHRIEGHRQKREDEGRTFKGKIGTKVMPDLISVIDDPTKDKLGATLLAGNYAFDDEGVRARPVTLIDHGVLKSFLMSRSPITGFASSNGHGRNQAGMAPVARQGSLIVQSARRVPRAELRAMLIDEIKKQSKPYGLYFDQIQGGFTFTQSVMPQAFKVLPLRVFRVYPDGRPDEEVRGVDIVGTPLASLERIIATGDDEDVFNGVCGAESGGVPVSASSPSLLVGTIEIERQGKSQERPPILPPPLHDSRKKELE